MEQNPYILVFEYWHGRDMNFGMKEWTGGLLALIFLCNRDGQIGSGVRLKFSDTYPL